MKLIVGLGNPGEKYAGTRHNIGFDVVLELLRRTGERPKEKFSGFFAKANLAGETVGFLMPTTFMNRSGNSVGPAMKYFGITPQEVVVIHDELDLPLGRLKLKVGGGHGGHNGLRSVTGHIGAEYSRLRCGIGRPAKGEVTPFVLGRFASDEREWAANMVDEAADAIERAVREGVSAAMNVVNESKG